MNKFWQALTYLLPSGFAWPRDPSSVLMRLVKALADALQELHDFTRQVANQWQPHQTITRLTEWEEATGLPDNCFSVPPATLEPGYYDLEAGDLAGFSRGTTGTYFDENGTLLTAPVNAPRFDHDLAQLVGEAPSVNLLLWSGDFDQAPWAAYNAVPVPGAAPPPGGTKAFKLTEAAAAGVTHYLVQSAGAYLAGEPFVYSAKLKAAERYLVQFRLMVGGAMTANRYAELNLSNGTNTTPGGLVGAGSLQMTPLGDGWYRVSITTTADANGPAVCAVFLEAPGFGNTYAGDGVSGLYVADAQLEPGLTMTSYIRTMAAIAYRLGVYAPLGLLIEAAATNSLIYSDQLDNAAAWSDIGLPTVTANTTLAPDGTLTADSLTDSSAVAYQGRGRVLAIPNDNLGWCFSLYIKKTFAGTAPTFAINYRLVNGVALSTQVRINTDTGAVQIGGTAATVTVKSRGGYWRFGIGLLNNGSGNTSLLVDLYPAASAYGGGLVDAVGATGTAVVWRVQCERGLIPSSDIQTGAAAVTRAADVALYIDPAEVVALRRKLLLARLRGPVLAYDDSSPACTSAIVAICAWMG